VWARGVDAEWVDATCLTESGPKNHKWRQDSDLGLVINSFETRRAVVQIHSPRPLLLNSITCKQRKSKRPPGKGHTEVRANLKELSIIHNLVTLQAAAKTGKASLARSPPESSNSVNRLAWSRIHGSQEL
jgi:hypothetical protein